MQSDGRSQNPTSHALRLQPRNMAVRVCSFQLQTQSAMQLSCRDVARFQLTLFPEDIVLYENGLLLKRVMPHSSYAAR